jgi:3-oxoacyl-[acyl-carrier protein] reductase
MTRSLTGKVALVTGAAKGIGAGMAKAMSAAGASVVVNFASDRTGEERVVADIKAADGNALAIQANVSVVAEVEHLFAEAVATFGPLDILVNNASVFALGAHAGFSPERGRGGVGEGRARRPPLPQLRRECLPQFQ